MTAHPRSAVAAALLCLLAGTTAASAEEPSANKRQAVTGVERQETALVGLSDQIWGFAETALRETRSAAVLADYAESQGFRVERGVAEMPSAFVATYGEGRPIIGILGEYDALPGLSQGAVPERQPLVAEGAGHGCGHNLFGPASLGAAVAIKELLAAGQLQGTVRFYGTPAEESVGGKVYMARAGLFSDLDAVVAWHPADQNRADTGSSQAMVDFVVDFFGRSSHAAVDPWNGRSAVDGLEIFTHALNMMREHIRPTARIHYTIVDGGDVPNVVPAHARLWCWVRDEKRTGVEEMMGRVRKMAEGAALAADVESRLTVQAGVYEMLPSLIGARLLQSNMEWLGEPRFSAEEQEFARQLQQAAGVEAVGIDSSIPPLNEHPGSPEGGSTDVADVSWIVPTVHLSAVMAPKGIPWHAWPVVASAGSSIGHHGMLYASRVLAATMVDLYEHPEQLQAMRQELDAKTRGEAYHTLIPDGPPPVPKDVAGSR